MSDRDATYAVAAIAAMRRIDFDRVRAGLAAIESTLDPDEYAGLSDAARELSGIVSEVLPPLSDQYREPWERMIDWDLLNPVVDHSDAGRALDMLS